MKILYVPYIKERFFLYSIREGHDLPLQYVLTKRNISLHSRFTYLLIPALRDSFISFSRLLPFWCLWCAIIFHTQGDLLSFEVDIYDFDFYLLSYFDNIDRIIYKIICHL